MSRFIKPETEKHVRDLMLGCLGGSERERFLYEELSRYAPELHSRKPEEIAAFIEYQRAVYIDGILPTFGRPVASLNPAFDLMDSLEFEAPGRATSTVATVKVNGYRMQIHRPPRHVEAFSRQFVNYDLRMFPEIAETLRALPIMVGDSELVAKYCKHNASLAILQDLRMPGAACWPRYGKKRLAREVFERYISDPKLFRNGRPHPEIELMLLFHGLYAVAHPKTWGRERWRQAENMIQLCKLPIDYDRIGEMLAQLRDYLKERGVGGGIVERKEVKSLSELKACFTQQEENGEEGLVVVQTIRDSANGRLLPAPHAIKVKRYETLDMAVLGVNLIDLAKPLSAENLGSAVLGLYDETHHRYLSATKVNLDPAGVQIKKEHQVERAEALRKELIAEIVRRGSISPGRLTTLWDVYQLEAEIMLGYLFKDVGYPETAWPLREVIIGVPRGRNLWSLYETFKADEQGFLSGTAKRTTAARRFIHSKIEFFKAVSRLDRDGLRRFRDYFSGASAIRARSARMIQPDLALDLSDPIVLEAKVFSIKWGTGSFPAGFHSWQRHSFCFSNNYAERVRYDKKMTTDYATVYKIARICTPRRPRRRRA